MFKQEILNLKKKDYNNIYVVEDINLWYSCANDCNKETDLVLCVDFALKHKLQEEGYFVEFLDHLMDNKFLEPLNFQLHDFLSKWYKDKNGEDILKYKYFNIGDSLLLYIINDVNYFCHFFFNILGIKSLHYNKLFVIVKDPIIKDCFKKAKFSIQIIENISRENQIVYSFPIKKWVKEKTHEQGRGIKVKDILLFGIDTFNKIIDNLFFKSTKKIIYIQKYYPTDGIIEKLSSRSDIRLVLQNYTRIKHIFKQRRISYTKSEIYNGLFEQLFDNFKSERCQKWEVASYPIGEFLYELIEVIIREELIGALQKADSIDNYFKFHSLNLMIPITNYWTANRLLMQYCYTHQIPVFLIINGLLSSSFGDEAKDANYVNCYSISIKECYFNNYIHAYPLGDPRMDKYAQVSSKLINRNNPVIIIGAAGYDSTDLNSYLSYEFDFLYDVLKSINFLKKKGYQSEIVLKVRGNGYAHLYESFINEYFVDLKVNVIQDQSFYETILQADLYISFYSQTLFEASCLGIPVIYYKKDTQELHQPFDNRSELVTALNVDDLIHKIEGFYQQSSVFEAFLSREVMEKYLGPLDGDNLKRNIVFIEKLINEKYEKLVD